MTNRTYTLSLSVLASMLEAGTVDDVYIGFHGVSPNDESCAFFYFTPKQLRNLDRGKHKPVAVKETLFEHSGRKKLLIGNGLRNYIEDRDQKWLGGPQSHLPPR